MLSVGFSKDDIKGWNTMQTTAFLAHLAQLSTSVPLKSASTRQMAQLYELDHSRNSEIQAAWFKSCLTAGDCPGHQCSASADAWSALAVCTS